MFGFLNKNLVITLVLGILVIGGTFLVFNDYLRPTLAADTGLQDPTAQGDPNSDWLDAEYFIGSDNIPAYTCSNNQFHDIYTYGLSGITGTIDGIIVNVEGNSDDPAETIVIEVELSWDGGTTYTSENKQNSFQSESIETYGGATDTWGRTWSASDFTDANFRVRVESISATGGACHNVDNIQVQVYYTESASDTCTPPTDDVWKMDLNDWCTTTESFYSTHGMECYNDGVWLIEEGVEVRVASTSNCMPRIKKGAVFSIQPNQ